MYSSDILIVAISDQIVKQTNLWEINKQSVINVFMLKHLKKKIGSLRPFWSLDPSMRCPNILQVKKV